MGVHKSANLDENGNVGTYGRLRFGVLGGCRSQERSQVVKKPVFWRLLERVHGDERGAVSLETILIIGAIALPILIFLIRIGWPRIRTYFEHGLRDLEEGADRARGSGI